MALFSGTLDVADQVVRAKEDAERVIAMRARAIEDGRAAEACNILQVLAASLPEQEIGDDARKRDAMALIAILR